MLDEQTAPIKNEAELSLTMEEIADEVKETHSTASINVNENPLQTSTKIASNKLKVKCKKSDPKEKKPKDKKV
jgi:hypothetical protein